MAVRSAILATAWLLVTYMMQPEPMHYATLTERAFSNARLILNDRRNRLIDVMFEQMLVAKHNGETFYILSFAVLC